MSATEVTPGIFHAPVGAIPGNSKCEAGQDMHAFLLLGIRSVSQFDFVGVSTRRGNSRNGQWSSRYATAVVAKPSVVDLSGRHSVVCEVVNPPARKCGTS